MTPLALHPPWSAASKPVPTAASIGASMASSEYQVLYPRAGAAVVALQGEHDLASAPTLRHCLTVLLESNDLVVVDLTEVAFVDSSILGVLIRVDQSAKNAAKQFRLQLGTEPIVMRILELSGLMDVLSCAPTRDAALDPGSAPAR